MFGVNKVLEFSIDGNFDNVRKIADDIIISLMKNDAKKDGEPLKRTYGSTIRKDFIYRLVKFFYEDYIPWSDYQTWTVRIYWLEGNRQSKLSIAQNMQLRTLVLDEEEPVNENEG